MIYNFPNHDEPIRQGDIFVGLPRLDLSLNEIVLVDDVDFRKANWDDLANKEDAMSILVQCRSVTAIVATQDCDASRSRDITLCQIMEFRDVERKSEQTSKPSKWKNIITQHARINQKWFYLPPDEEIGFPDKMAVDFLVTLRIPRVDLEMLRGRRKGRLNEYADEHFRERMAQFFRRYPYDEWYALDQEELSAYEKEYPGIKPFPWQES